MQLLALGPVLKLPTDCCSGHMAGPVHHPRPMRWQRARHNLWKEKGARGDGLEDLQAFCADCR